MAKNKKTQNDSSDDFILDALRARTKDWVKAVERAEQAEAEVERLRKLCASVADSLDNECSYCRRASYRLFDAAAGREEE